jgi:hypothetical protein
MTSIITNHIYPPIPQRQFDWVAYFDDNVETPSQYGYGKTRLEALVDLADTTVEDLCGRRDALERQLATVREIEPPTWSQEDRIAALLGMIESINDKILALDNAIEAAEAETPR